MAVEPQGASSWGRSILFLLGVLLVAALGFSCGPSLSLCRNLGKACAAAGECGCEGTQCLFGSCCAEDKTLCKQSQDCCAGTCTKGICCKPVGSSCDSSGGCCVGLQCVSGRCCGGVGAACASRSDCCSFFCNNVGEAPTCRP